MTAMDERFHIFDLDRSRLSRLVEEWGLPRYRADQVLEWVYRHQVGDPASMTNLSRSDQELLARRLRFTTGRIVARQTATDGVRKLLIDWSGTSDGNEKSQTECVLIPSEQRNTACISSQVGCPVGCRFCASGLGGLDANLTAGRIVEQVWQLGGSTLEEAGTEAEIGRTRDTHQSSSPDPRAAPRPITHVVFMGMGEPLANFEQVVAAVGTLTADWGPNISARRITISTVGLPAQIRRLAELRLPVTLAISLHAPNDELRRRLIPWADYVQIEQLLDAGSHYFACTGREVTLEYILLRQVNDRPEHARQLAEVARRLRSNVNLIRYNEVKGLPFSRPATDDVWQFQQILRSAGINTHIRASRGRDIAAACGQLRVQGPGSRVQSPESGVGGSGVASRES